MYSCCATTGCWSGLVLVWAAPMKCLKPPQFAIPIMIKERRWRGQDPSRPAGGGIALSVLTLILRPPPLQWLAPRAWIGDFSHGVSELAADGRATLLATSSMSFLLPPRTADGGRRHDSVSNVTGPQPVAIGHPDSCAAGLDAGKRRIRIPATIGPCSRLSDGLWKKDQGPHGGPAWDWRSDGDGTAWVRSGRRSFFKSA